MAIYQLLSLHPKSAWVNYHLEGAVFQADERDHHIWGEFTPFPGWDTFDQVEFLNSPLDSHPKLSTSEPVRFTILACTVRRLFK